ncbi:MAG: hypothetical protein AB1589_40145 [Cyanobacteriota bacterium]
MNDTSLVSSHFQQFICGDLQVKRYYYPHGHTALVVCTRSYLYRVPRMRSLLTTSVGRQKAKQILRCEEVDKAIAPHLRQASFKMKKY